MSKSALFLASCAALAIGCGDPDCPDGTEYDGKRCVTIDAGVDGGTGIDGGSPDGSMDGGRSDAAVDSGAEDAGPVGPPGIRPVAPTSAWCVGTQQPMLRWELRGSATGAVVEICSVPGCELVEHTYRVTGSEKVVEDTLDPGPWFWRIKYVDSDGSVAASAGPTWTFTVAGSSERFESGWPCGADFNRDGLSDTVYYDARVYVYMGSRDATEVGTPTYDLAFPETYEYRGENLKPVGDINGDGYGDAAFTFQCEPAAGTTCTNHAVVLYAGRSTGLDPVPVGRIDIEDDLAVEHIGDVDGDGYSDFAIATVTDEVAIGLVRGRPDFAAIDVEPVDFLDASGIFGGVYGVGDVNADGLADFVKVRIRDDETRSARIHLGSRTSPSSFEASTVIENPDGEHSKFPGGPCTAGDQNGDGYGDILLASPCHPWEGRIGDFDLPVCGIGRVYLHRGTSTGLATDPAFTLTEDSVQARFGASMAWLGDVDGDGIDDLGIISRGYYFGHPDGTFPEGSILYGNPTAGFSTVPPPEASWYGGTIRGVGDMNGDGYADMRVNEYIFLGSSSGLTLVE